MKAAHETELSPYLVGARLSRYLAAVFVHNRRRVAGAFLPDFMEEFIMKTFARHGSAIAVACILAALMGVTRFHALGSTVSLPDASLAVFFLAGVYLAPSWVFTAFLAEAALIDYVAITHGGVSAWCVSPAYAFLIPTYGVLWYTGRCVHAPTGLSWRSWTLALGGALGASVVAFAISNMSFYWFSGRFTGVEFGAYIANIISYLPSYVGATFVYVSGALVVGGLLKTWRMRLSARAGTPDAVLR